MTYIRTFMLTTALSSAALATSAWSVTDNEHNSHHLAPDAVIQVAQAQLDTTSPGMRADTTAPGYADHMKAMQQMHDKMMATKTPEERNALMAEQMRLMQGGMNMMGRMGGKGMMGGGMGTGATADTPADMAERQAMMEQRMDMMQSMMQTMIDRMQTVPATK